MNSTMSNTLKRCICIFGVQYTYIHLCVYVFGKSKCNNILYIMIRRYYLHSTRV